MEYLKKRLKFILIIIFSIAVIAFVQYELHFDKNLDIKKVGMMMTILQAAAGGYGLYGLVQFFRVK
ncbi:hypothetical protein FD33_GL000551 [Companilactobacillus paralimentarius DSM 13238 = JCM 10415]|uniref:Uncharacterized protein n=1 Tax=Companilactobacillus paralimentarius DSM 13238 = JCM 10415 TaxID=1122151 RepID=A0A0R1PUD9_9LACO|nr:hypothetical protein [Companilactobacillus paralimentarius]KAE9563871.1 hypothetical protein ATN96_09950 [Companilactobacillus paralimentarius]KRL32387.1 hypothetical protein FD33_GL000551 [Companilactobacillus paralimentarius DSM 13238 = JCM 10415]MDR4932833.1 hypothetical protein [Companilactobacillus paralimentarius]QFR69382.1 hypothetical protein LP238_05915 [Companilactobacillus paralimentarius]